MNRFGNIKAIIFDMDGTILDTIEDITDAVNYILSKYNMPERSVDEVKGFVGNGLFLTLKRSAPQDADEALLDSIYEEMVAYYKDHSKIHTKPYDGIVELLMKLKKAGYKTAVVSNKRHEAVVKLCEEYYKGLFDTALGDMDGIAKKPEPDMINIVLKELGVEKTDALYIGDSDVDVLTSSNSGLKGIFVSWGFRTRDFLIEHGAKTVVDTPEELLSYIITSK